MAINNCAPVFAAARKAPAAAARTDRVKEWKCQSEPPAIRALQAPE
jgi:hypothetical protein